MKIIYQIKVTSVNLMQVFKLPCVSQIVKGKDDLFGDFDVAISLRPDKMADELHGEGWYNAAFIGDMLVEYEDHKWRAWRTKHSMIDPGMRRLMSVQPKQLELFNEEDYGG